MLRLFWRDRTARDPLTTISTPTATMVVGTVLMLGLAMLIPERPASQRAHAAEVAPQQLSQGTPGRPISLRDRLITGLKARLKSEIAFVDQVVALVNAGELPQRLVDETFFWARDRALLRHRYARRRRPVIYFQPAMIARANRLGVNL